MSGVVWRYCDRLECDERAVAGTAFCQNCVIRDRLTDVHAEYFKKLAELIENKIDAISVMMCMYVSEETDEQREWSYILDDIFYNSNKVVNSPYRPVLCDDDGS